MAPPVSAGEFTIEFFEDDDRRSPVEEWMDSDLTDLELAALLSGLERVLSHRGVDVCKTEWGKQLGEGLFEFRIRHTSAGIKLAATGQQLVVLLELADDLGGVCFLRGHPVNTTGVRIERSPVHDGTTV